MHMVILALVYADDAEGAMDEAKRVFAGLCENQRPFDYYVTFDQDGGEVAGKDRWGPRPVVARADSPEGQKLIAETVEAQRQEFFENLDRVRKGLARFTNEDFWADAKLTDAEIAQNRSKKGEPVWDTGMVRHFMFHAGEYEGSSTWLYDHDGSGIHDQAYLDTVLSGKYADGKVIWVIPADVHH